ncbi:MAG: hypothetical protein IGS54_18315 [Elainella sp. C42_A2020_010]|nr:hypothetical protein [Elainella sp. C42_A2020_010]
MQSGLEDLRITPHQLEKLTGMEISDTFMGRAYRPTVFHSFHQLLPFLITEALTFGLILVFCLPIGLVIGRGFGLLSGDASNTITFLLVMLSFSGLLFAGWNVYMWWQGKKLRTLAHLLDQVDKHNQIIEAVRIMDELRAVRPTMQLLDRTEVLEALAATRETLINALLTEKILRKHQSFIARRQELFATIETNLATLQTLQIDAQASEYGQLLNQALQIGLSLRHEIDQWNEH